MSEPVLVRFIGPGDERTWKTIDWMRHRVYLTRTPIPEHMPLAVNEMPASFRCRERVYRREMYFVPCGPLATPAEWDPTGLDPTGLAPPYVDVAYVFASESAR